jgi:hypothetical protein
VRSAIRLSRLLTFFWADGMGCAPVDPGAIGGLARTNRLRGDRIIYVALDVTIRRSQKWLAAWEVSLEADSRRCSANLANLGLQGWQPARPLPGPPPRRACQPANLLCIL